MKVAKAKVWRSTSGALVADGHADAAFLVAMPGHTVPDNHPSIAGATGIEEFFTDLNPKAPALEQESPAVTTEPEAADVIPKPKKKGK